MNIALLGFGTVGSHFYKLCEGRTDLHVAAVLSRRPRPELTCTVTADYDEIVRDPSIDIVVEVMGGIEPAYSYLCAAMRAGKHVVTANKQLMCAHFEELTSLAKEKGVAGAAAIGSGIYANHKNKETADKLLLERQNVEVLIRKFNVKNAEVAALTEATQTQIDGVQRANAAVTGADYSQFSHEEKMQAGLLVNMTLTLAQMINKELELDD